MQTPKKDKFWGSSYRKLQEDYDTTKTKIGLVIILESRSLPYNPIHDNNGHRFTVLNKICHQKSFYDNKTLLIRVRLNMFAFIKVIKSEE